MSIGRAALTVGGLTAVSRVAGLGRDLLIAAALGAGPVADAFFVALKLANFLRRLFAEGAFSAAFVPLYGRLVEAAGAVAARRFAGEALAVLAVVLALVVAAAELAMPVLVRALAPGFAPGSERYALAVELGRITFPYLIAVSLAAVVAAMLQAGHRFAAAAGAPILVNLVLIAVLLATDAVGADAARLLAWGVAGAGLVQLAWLLLVAARAGLAPSLQPPRLSPEVRRLLRLIGPGLLGVGVLQVNMLVASWFATHLAAGTVAHLFYAERLVQLPLGVIGVALGTALLPSLSDAVRQGRSAPAALNQALELALLLGVPAAAGLVLLAEPIIAVLFERGAFDARASEATAAVLAMLALGVPAQIMARVLAPGFFALHDTATPAYLAAATVAANVALATLLGGFMGGPGIALASALASWVGAGIMALLLRRRGVLAPDAGLRRRAGGILAAATAMAAVLLLARGGIAGATPLTLAALIAAGAGTFLLTAVGAGGVDRRAFAALRRGGRA